MDYSFLSVLDKLIDRVPLFLKILEKIESWFHERKEVLEIDVETLKNLMNLYKIFEKLKEEERLLENKEIRAQFENAEKFFEKYAIGWSSKRGKYVIIRKDYEEFQRYLEKIITLKKVESKSFFFITTLDIGFNYEELKTTPKYLEEDLVQVISRLPSNIKFEFISLINLSIHIEKLYLDGRMEEAENIKKSIKSVYGDFGLKFLNLFQRKYLKTFLRTLKEKDPLTMEKEIRKFFEEDTRYIFFIHKDMTIDDIEKIKIKVKIALQNKENYVAIHSLGEATLIAESIIKDIEKNKIPEEYTRHMVDKPTDYKTFTEKREEASIRDFSVIWYKGEAGKRLFGFLLNFV